MILNRAMESSPDLALCMNDLLCWKCNTQIAFMHSNWPIKLQGKRVIDKYLYLNETAHNSRDASSLSVEDFTEIAFAKNIVP